MSSPRISVQLADGTLGALVSSAKYLMHAAIVIPKPAHLHGRTSPAATTPPCLLHPQPALQKASLSRCRVVLNAKGDELRESVPGSIPDPSTPVDTDHIHGQLFLPAGMDLLPNRFKDSTYKGHKHPAILFFHGGPKSQMLLGYPAMDYYSNAYAMNQYLASRGYIVLSVNYRGGIGYGLNFRQCEHCGADGAGQSTTTSSLRRRLPRAPRADVDSARIGLWGGSYGGYLTALGLARNSNLFAAGVDFHGVHEWARGNDNATTRTGSDRHRGRRRRGPTEKIAALAHASSPMADIDKWHSSVLLIHGDNDPEVAYAQTPTLADALRARHVPVEELIFPDEVHGFLLHKDWLAAYQAAADFFDRTLKPSKSAPIMPRVTHCFPCRALFYRLDE